MAGRLRRPVGRDGEDQSPRTAKGEKAMKFGQRMKRMRRSLGYIFALALAIQ